MRPTLGGRQKRPLQMDARQRATGLLIGHVVAQAAQTLQQRRLGRSDERGQEGRGAPLQMEADGRIEVGPILRLEAIAQSAIHLQIDQTGCDNGIAGIKKIEWAGLYIGRDGGHTALSQANRHIFMQIMGGDQLTRPQTQNCFSVHVFCRTLTDLIDLPNATLSYCRNA